MTHAEIDVLQAGRELDALVAEKVFGMIYVKGLKITYAPNADVAAPPHYSTDIAAAWEVVEKSHPNSWFLWWHDSAAEWVCQLDGLRCVIDACRVSASADTAPLAICRAALKAVVGREG